MDESIKDFQKIQILLHEYASLRNELLSRYVAQYQSSAVLAVVSIGLITLWSRGDVIGSTSISLMGGTFFLYLVVLIWIDYDIAKAATRLRKLEKEINTRAGETLLTWETDWGLGGIIGRHVFRWLHP